MPGLQGEHAAAAALGSPARRNKLSLKFLQKKDTKRALDFSEPQTDEARAADPPDPEPRWVCGAGTPGYRWMHYSFPLLLEVEMSASVIQKYL